MDQSPNIFGPRGDRAVAWGGALLTALLMVWAASWTGDAGTAIRPTVFVLIGSVPFVAGWLAAAVGFGWPLRATLARSGSGRQWNRRLACSEPGTAETAVPPSSPLALQVALGVAVMLTLDAGLGALGVLQFAGSTGAWGLLVVGWALLIACVWRDDVFKAYKPTLPPWTIWIAAPALAVGLLAACSAPGWLWASEFGGYDALSYHLQLPKEWLALGRIQPLEHNVYSAFPSYMEAAYYHLMVLRGSAVEASYACQLLHFSLTIIAALLAGHLVARRISPLGGIVAAVAVLATPWTIVVGTLAYNESAVVLMLVACLVVVDEHNVKRHHHRDTGNTENKSTEEKENGDGTSYASAEHNQCDQNREANPTSRTQQTGISPRDSSVYSVSAVVSLGALLGLFAGVACGVKLTAAGMVMLPMIVLALAMTRIKRWPALLAAFVGVCVVVLLPYVVRNMVHLGQPVFPFVPGMFGTAHWSIEQAAIWNVAHSTDASLSGRIAALWNQWLRYGIGENPDPTEPWMAQWSILPWLGVLGLCCGVFSRQHVVQRWSARVLTLLVIQLVFWLGFTHLQSRFLLPSVIALALGTAVLAHTCMSAWTIRSRANMSYRIAAVMTCLVMFALALIPVVVFAAQANGAPAARVGVDGLLTGRALTPNQREQVAMNNLPGVYLNYLLPETSKILLVGDAAPFYYHANIAYTTTWDRGPWSRAMDEHPDQPEMWIQTFREHGFTHVLVQPHMIERWQRSGWNDPQLNTQNIQRLVDRMDREQHWPNLGTSLYRLP